MRLAQLQQLLAGLPPQFADARVCVRLGAAADVEIVGVDVAAMSSDLSIALVATRSDQGGPAPAPLPPLSPLLVPDLFRVEEDADWNNPEPPPSDEAA
jgi:hypothetical protein